MTTAAPHPPPLPAPSPAPVREAVLGVEWVIWADAAAALCAAKALDVRALAQSPDARLVEQIPDRTVFRARIPKPGTDGLEIDATIFRRPRARDLLLSLFRGARARRAWRAAEALDAAGIPAPRILAAGTRRSLGVLRDDALIAEATDATPLPALLDSMGVSARAKFIRRIAPVLAQMVRRMHDRGLAYRDFDAGRVLVRELAEGVRQLMPGGLETLRLGGATPLGRRLDNLAQLAASLDGISRTDRRRFWKHYIAGLEHVERHEADYARVVASHAEALRRARWARLERESLGDHVGFKRVRVERWRGHTVRARMEIEREILARIPAGGMIQPDATVIKEAPEARIYEQVIEFGAGTETIIVKHKRRVGARGVLRTFLRRVGAVRAWRTLWALRARGISVEQPLAAFERRRCGLTFESVLVTKKVAEAENLYRFVEAQASSMTPRSRRDLARALGRFARQLHAAGFASRDLKAANILVQAEKSGGVTLTLVDVEGVERFSEVPEAIRARDLGRLAADFVRMPGVRATDFARVLDGYLAGCDVPRQEKRALIRGIFGRVREKLAAWDSKRS